MIYIYRMVCKKVKSYFSQFNIALYIFCIHATVCILVGSENTVNMTSGIK